MRLAQNEVPVAYSMVLMAQQPAISPQEAFLTYACYWTAFNNIYVTLSEQNGRRAQYKTNPDGSIRTRSIAHVNISVVETISEREQIDVAFSHLSEDLKIRLIEHPSTEFFVYRIPRWHGSAIVHDAHGQLLNGVLNVGRTLDRNNPVWSPINPQAYERYMSGNRTLERADELAKQILDLLYTVRNNSFHGGKRMDDANDREVIEKACPLLEMIVRSFIQKTDGV